MRLGRGLRDVLLAAYGRNLARELTPDSMPRHIAVMLDGNRRWAKARGAGTQAGHQAGADNIANLLSWCDELHVEIVTLWLLSTDNLARPENELKPLLEIIENVVDALADTGHWRINVLGARALLPEGTAQRLLAAAERTKAAQGMVVNIAVGYGGRREITDAVRSLLLSRAEQGATLEELARSITVDDIGDHLYTAGQPDPDLVIRTSGEQRVSGFLLWQSVHSELYFCEAYWPDFRKVDFLRALRAYGERSRRFGS